MGSDTLRRASWALLAVAGCAIMCGGLDLGHSLLIMCGAAVLGAAMALLVVLW